MNNFCWFSFFCGLLLDTCLFFCDVCRQVFFKFFFVILWFWCVFLLLLLFCNKSYRQIITYRKYMVFLNKCFFFQHKLSTNIDFRGFFFNTKHFVWMCDFKTGGASIIVFIFVFFFLHNIKLRKKNIENINLDMKTLKA